MGAQRLPVALRSSASTVFMSPSEAPVGRPDLVGDVAPDLLHASFRGGKLGLGFTARGCEAAAGIERPGETGAAGQELPGEDVREPRVASGEDHPEPRPRLAARETGATTMSDRPFGPRLAHATPRARHWRC
jgi:hypothetical protein